MLRKLFLLAAFILFYQYGFSEVFTVTNNNDSGAGSFRDAITKSNANGNTEVDYIYFNIPGISVDEHTIKIQTELPEINTDIVIDGSTQAGDFASYNKAKIILDGEKFTFTQFTNSILSVNGVRRFELYGFVIRNFYSGSVGSIRSTTALFFSKETALVSIGNVDKGNVIYNMYGLNMQYDGANKGSITNLRLVNNYIGVHEDGLQIADKVRSGSNLYRVSKAMIGGSSKAEGNVIYGDFGGYGAIPRELQVNQMDYLIQNNIFYANRNEERPGISGNVGNMNGVGFSVDANLNHTGGLNISILDNVFGVGFNLHGFDNADILIQRNSFGISKNLQHQLPFFTQALSLRSITGKALIGGTSTAEGNNFTNTNSHLPYQKLFPGAVWIEQSSQIELSHNSFFCNPEMPLLYTQTGPFATATPKPIEALLDNVTSNSVSGRSKPGARIELFYSDPECTNCQPKRYFATVKADANGNWIYNGAIESGYSVLAGATLNGVSSEFSDPRIYKMTAGQEFKVTPQTCNTSNAKIEGTYLVNVNKVEWVDEAGNVVGTQPELKDVPAGKYQLKAYQFGCIIYSEWVTITDNRPQLGFNGTPNLVHPSCNNLGSILNLYPNYYKEMSWLDEQGNEVGRDRELKNVPAGKYTLRLVGECVTRDFGPYTLISSSGPAASYTNARVSNTTCEGNLGSIKGITTSGAGTLTYKWTNDKSQTVGTNLDLENVGAGKYKLEIKDGSACPPIFSQLFDIIVDGGITLNQVGVDIKKSACNVANGYVKGVIVSGATTFSWVDRQGRTVSSTQNLENVTAGEYKLIATNGNGCREETNFFTVGQYQPRTFANYTVSASDAICGLNNVTLSFSGDNDVNITGMRWLNENNQLVGTRARVSNLPEGTYRLFLKDENGCETLYQSITANRIPLITADKNKVKINPDLCGQNIGSISGIIITGGKTPFIYSWKNENLQQIGDKLDIFNLPAGTYSLHIRDASNCEISPLSFTLQNQSTRLITPTLDAVSICAPMTVNVSVKNPSSNGAYRLYSSFTATTPIIEQNHSVFQINAESNATYYVTQVVGECESERGVLKIQLKGAELKIPNSFSPNDDGINDFWSIPDLDKYPDAKIKIFNRTGNLVFEYVGSSLKFDGKYKGAKLPLGVYYYIISLSKNCRQMSGSLLIL
ncbi:gliding motility-associated C-terminal domain-containing protein [Pedobacter helvus]|uniref:Gliding motility-associated C-terminal domain-containing protein n=1 Tax=Pedobacter helvus TaxID=2563444 RepID=A0ABW9JG10_9SPHI|nr:gliding motility-associated C-terminal domain-containing protein [Pedobacter ureilyticus]